VTADLEVLNSSPILGLRLTWKKKFSMELGKISFMWEPEKGKAKLIFQDIASFQLFIFFLLPNKNIRISYGTGRYRNNWTFKRNV